MILPFPRNRDQFFECKKSVEVTAHEHAHGRSQPLTVDANPSAHTLFIGMKVSPSKNARRLIAWVRKHRLSLRFLTRLRFFVSGRDFTTASGEKMIVTTIVINSDTSEDTVSAIEALTKKLPRARNSQRPRRSDKKTPSSSTTQLLCIR